jgi:hypothetical protein
MEAVSETLSDHDKIIVECSPMRTIAFLSDRLLEGMRFVEKA